MLLRTVSFTLAFMSSPSSPKARALACGVFAMIFGLLMLLFPEDERRPRWDRKNPQKLTEATLNRLRILGFCTLLIGAVFTLLIFLYTQ